MLGKSEAGNKLGGGISLGRKGGGGGWGRVSNGKYMFCLLPPPRIKGAP